jgi:hypothetical protein
VDVTEGNRMLLVSAACQRGHSEMLRALLQHSDIDPSLKSNWSYHQVPETYNNEALQFAAETGADDMIEMLLSSAKFKPTESDHYAFARAVDGHHMYAFDVLLQDSRLKFNFIHLLRSASTIGFEDGVESLLKIESLVIQHKEELNKLVDLQLLHYSLAKPSEALLNYKTTSVHYAA